MSKEPNLYQRKGVWWLRTSVSGREFRESLRTKNVAMARRIRDKRLEEINAAARFGVAKRTWEDAVIAYIDHAEGQLQPTTAKRYAVSFKQCLPFLTGRDIAAIDGKAIGDLMAARKRAGATAATIRRDLTAISRVLTFAEGQGWREGNPTLSKRRTIRERRDPIALPDAADVESMIAACSESFGALVRAAWLTGCRQDELVTATWSALNFEAGTLEVIGKGRKRRVMTLSDKALEFLRAQVGAVWIYGPAHPIFQRSDGEPFREAASDFGHFRRELEKRDPTFRRFRFHDLRHLFAVEYLRDGGNLYTLSKMLGHTSVKTTEAVYLAFLTPEQAERAKS